MADPKDSRKSSKGGRYYVWRDPSGETTERYFSVTTIIDGGIPKPALMGWAVKQTAIYAIENHELLRLHIAKDLDDNGKLPAPGADGKIASEGCMEAYKLLWNSRWAKAQKAADLGTYIHEAIEAYVLDQPHGEWPADAAPYLENAVRFLTDFGVLVESVEASVYNRTQKYAGTLDMIATINGERWLIDFKTGSGVYPEAALQMAAYAHAEFIGKPDRSEEPMPKIDHAAVVHLQPDGYKVIPAKITDAVFSYFMYAREVFRWCEFDQKEALADPVKSLDELVEIIAPREEVSA